MTGSGPKNPNWKGGRTVTKAGYVLLRMPGHHLADVRGYVYEHRLVAEQKEGRRLRRGEEVHHRGAKDDNRPHQLEPLTRQQHLAEHRTRNDLRPVGAPNPMVDCGCGCGERFRKYDEANRPREYVSGHNDHPSPTADAILAALDGGPMSRVELVEKLGMGLQAVAVCLSKLKRGGRVESAGHGVWQIRKKR